MLKTELEKNLVKIAHLANQRNFLIKQFLKMKDLKIMLSFIQT